ncbi:hypothetical protein GGX14DRAFT_637563 [Mycena pura]|uniref:Uncharacterized protein n=1 Tax=Mycena pura TaxID=153505 RepID=A0AAD6YAY6_9AGAR|nr:hypothetical protein GGX14DRAFT_637563 [Mycena pura]
MQKLPRNFSIDDIPPCYDAAVATTQLNALTPDQKARLSVGIAIAASDPQADVQFRNSATAAGRSGGHRSDFLPTFEAIQVEFRAVVSDSRSLAVRIAFHAEIFDVIIVKFCADESLTVQERVDQIKKFIEDGEGYRGDAEKMHRRFQDLKDKFEVIPDRVSESTSLSIDKLAFIDRLDSSLATGFREWAKPLEGAKTDRIETLEDEIEKLHKEIAHLKVAIAEMAAALAATLALTAFLVLAFPLGAPFFIAAGAVVAGIQTNSLTGLVKAKNGYKKDLYNKEKEVTRIEEELKTIRGMRSELEKEGANSLNTFIASIMVLQQTWLHVQADAEAIKKWLEHGADMAEYPTYMKENLDHSVKIYKQVARYLRDYAGGIARIVKRF